jgi:hypothetical protein
MLNINQPPEHQESALEQMLRRIKGEFLEMPGLRLTCRQAQRLWNLDAIVCESLLAALVDVRFLVETDGVFLQRTDGTGIGRLRHAGRLS